MFERLSAHFKAASPSRAYMLYGPGVEDIYLSPSTHELHFDAALFETLQAQGYERIIFFTLHRSVYFYDDRSKDLSRPQAPPRVMRRAPRSRRRQPRVQPSACTPSP